MSLYTETRGQGEDIVLLHGWGFHGDVWKSVTTRLIKNYRVTCVDLPGYGRSQHAPGNRMAETLDEITTAVAKNVPDKAAWVGWSLGGLLALNQSINNPESINKLILIASSPQFTQADDWNCAIAEEHLQRFNEELEHDYQGIITRFLSLQAQGCPDAKEQIRTLQAEIFKHGHPSVDTLRNGLTLLQQTRLRSKLPTINIPTLIIAGKRDRLVPPAAIEATQRALINATSFFINNAGHAPFLSHPGIVADEIMMFLNQRPILRKSGTQP